jgi:hypothetical protein
MSTSRNTGVTPVRGRHMARGATALGRAGRHDDLVKIIVSLVDTGGRPRRRHGRGVAAGRIVVLGSVPASSPVPSQTAMSIRPFAAVLAAVVLAGRGAAAQTATQTVNFQVDPINQIAISAPSVSLAVSSATAGGTPQSTPNATTTWAVTTNQTGAKVTAALSSAMPTGLTLSVGLAAPAGATSAGAQALGTTAVDLVTGLTKLNQSGLTVTYTLAATAAAGVVAPASRVVTYTITGGT